MLINFKILKYIKIILKVPNNVFLMFSRRHHKKTQQKDQTHQIDRICAIITYFNFIFNCCLNSC